MPTDFIPSLEECFGDLLHSRLTGRCDHKLLDIIIMIYDVLCDADSWVGIEIVGKASQHD